MEVQGEKQESIIKIIVNKADDERVVGVQCCGRGVDEMMQGVGIAIKMKATKTDFHNCLAIHPTGSEEFVLLDPEYN